MPKLDDQDRLRLVFEYRDSGLSQQAFCAALEARGIDVSPRTLRAWNQRFGAANNVPNAVQSTLERMIPTLERLVAMIRSLDGLAATASAEPSPDNVGQLSGGYRFNPGWSPFPIKHLADVSKV